MFLGTGVMTFYIYNQSCGLSMVSCTFDYFFLLTCTLGGPLGCTKGTTINHLGGMVQIKIKNSFGGMQKNKNNEQSVSKKKNSFKGTPKKVQEKKCSKCR